MVQVMKQWMKPTNFIKISLIYRRLADMNMSLLYLTPSVISEEDNNDLNRPSTFEEVERVVFELNGDSLCGLDDFSLLVIIYLKL